jgi:hypothetical protein
MSVGEIEGRLGVATIEGDGAAKLGHGLLIEAPPLEQDVQVSPHDPRVRWAAHGSATSSSSRIAVDARLRRLPPTRGGGLECPTERSRTAGIYVTRSTETLIRIFPHPPLSIPTSEHCTTAVRSLFGSEWAMKRS